MIQRILARRKGLYMKFSEKLIIVGLSFVMIGTFAISPAIAAGPMLQFQSNVPPPNAITRTISSPPADRSGMKSLTLSPDAVYAGQSTMVTLLLASPAAAQGAKVSLGAAPAGVATLPSIVHVPGKQITTSFLVTTVTGASGTVTISAALQGAASSLSAPLRVVAPPPAVVGFSGFPGEMRVGASVTGTVRLAGPAHGGGATVAIYATNNSDAMIPATTTVAAGQSSGPLTIQARQRGGVILLYPTAADLQASRNYTRIQINSVPQMGSLKFKICEANTSSCSANSTTIDSGGNIPLWASVSNPWPDPFVVSFSSSNPQVATIDPASITLGMTFYGVTTVKSTRVISPTAVTITATCQICQGTQTATAVLNLVPPAVVTSLTLAQASVKGASTTTGTVTLNNPAGPAGTRVDFTSSNPSICSTPPSLTIQAGQSSGNFMLVTQPVLSAAAVAISAAVAGGASQTTSLRVVP